MEKYHILELAIIVLGIYILSHKIKKPDEMDIYDLIDHDAKLICDAMLSQTNIARLQYFYKNGLLLMDKKYKTKVEEILLQSYLKIIDETYLLCKKTIQQGPSLNIACLN